MKGKVIMKEDITKCNRYACIKHTIKKLILMWQQII